MSDSKKGIPDNLAEMLKNAETFEAYFSSEKRRDERYEFQSKYVEFNANQADKNISSETKEQLISAFLIDVKKGGEPSRCYIPHHGIRAVYKNQLIEIAICYMCGWFRGQIDVNTFYGYFPDEDESKTKFIFDKIFSEQ